MHYFIIIIIIIIIYHHSGNMYLLESWVGRGDGPILQGEAGVDAIIYMSLLRDILIQVIPSLFGFSHLSPLCKLVLTHYPFFCLFILIDQLAIKNELWDNGYGISGMTSVLEVTFDIRTSN